jgi:hypothetical protein
VSLRFVTLRVQLPFLDVGEVQVESFRVRVKVMKRAFSACESLLDEYDGLAAS